MLEIGKVSDAVVNPWLQIGGAIAGRALKDLVNPPDDEARREAILWLFFDGPIWLRALGFSVDVQRWLMTGGYESPEVVCKLKQVRGVKKL